MSDGTKGGWKLTFRDDEIATLKAVLKFVIERHEWSLSARRTGTWYEIDALAHQIAKERVQEILTYIEGTCG